MKNRKISRTILYFLPLTDDLSPFETGLTAVLLSNSVSDSTEAQELSFLFIIIGFSIFINNY